MTGQAWYIAITNPNCHRRAECELASLGYRAFWPKMRRWVSHARTKTVKEYPIMGRYLFVEIPDDHGFWAVRNVNGIEGLVTYADDEGAPKPAAVPESVVWGFRVRYMAGEWDFVRDFRPVFEKGKIVDYVRNMPIPIGARIRIMEGEFADMLATVRGRERGKLKVLPLGERNFVHMRESNVRAA